MRVLFLEPFDAGSHRRFRRELMAGLVEDHGIECAALTMPGRHWKWRMRGAVPWLAQTHDAELRAGYDLLFASSYVALAELLGLYPQLAQIPSLLYFHENQLSYPQRPEFAAPRDEHFGFTQMVSALAATCCVFNSDYNRQTFLDAGEQLIQRMPDARPDGWRERVAARSEVLGLPIRFPSVDGFDDVPVAERGAGPTLLWNHRWEHDKNPDGLFPLLGGMAASGLPFRLLVCGEQFRAIPESMQRARVELADRIDHFGYVEGRATYEDLLRRSQIVLSTAVHEFFGLSVLEAVWCGARPLVPDRLAYRELLPAQYRYTDLATELPALCRRWVDGSVTLRADRRDLVAAHAAPSVVRRYLELFEELCAG